jgi:hypothetical protein
MADRLRITELDFDTIKANLKGFLNQQSTFTDYDFDGSGLSILLDILAYNTHYNAYYLNMVANEAFLDTALLRDSAVSHAKTLGYTPYSNRSSVATINFEATSSSSNTGTLTLPAGFSFLSESIDNKSYNFIVLDDTTVTKANSTYLFENLSLYEGQYVTYIFNYNESANPKAVFTIPDSSIDTTTISVTVQQSSSNTSTTTYNKVTEVLDVGPTSEVFFLQEERNGRYQIYFGNDAVGKKLPDGAVINVNYVVTNGSIANKANNFVATSSISDSLSESLSTFTVSPISAAAGGAERETVDNIKFSAAAQFSSQNRLVSYKDYESYILANYPNISSISVWGGEENDPPVYGKVFISMKPKDNYYISETEKARIVDEIVKPKAIIAVSAEILDPEYLYLIVEADVEYDNKKTTLSETALKTAIRNAILSYRNTNLNKFDARYVHSKIEGDIDAVERNAIIGCETIVRAQKRFTPTLNSSLSYTIDYNIPLHRGTITNRLTSTEFDVLDSGGTRRTVILEEIGQSYSGIASISVTNPGTGYTTAPTVTITGDGSGATATATIVNGAVESITITNRGIDYTRALVTISGGNGYGATGTAVIDARTGALRTIYYDSNAERQIVDSTAGEVNYDTGRITINDINILSVGASDGQIRLTIEADEGSIETDKNTIITIDETDTSSIVTNLTKVT